MLKLMRLFLLNVIILTIMSCAKEDKSNNTTTAEEHIKKYSAEYLACKEPDNSNKPECKKVKNENNVKKDQNEFVEISNTPQNENSIAVLEKIIQDDKENNNDKNHSEVQNGAESKLEEIKPITVQQDTKQIQNEEDYKGKAKTKEEAEAFLKIKVDVFAIDKDDLVLGDRNSRVVVLEYSSPTCYHCAYYRNNVFPEVAKKYIETKKIAYVIRQFTVSRQDVEAASLIYCAPMEKRYSFIDILYKQQQNWAFNNKYSQNLVNIAKIGGLSEEVYKECLTNNDLVNKLLAFTKAIGSTEGFVGTPSLHINGKKLESEHSMQNIINAIDKAIDKAIEEKK